MLFYFTGTGNSYDAALQIACCDRLINIAECVANKDYSFTLEDDEAVGLVFPVYFGGIPSIVHTFIKNLEFDKTPEYLYGVLTCGGNKMASEAMFAKELAQNGFNADAVYSVTMPGNYVLMYEPPKDEKMEQILEASKTQIAEIKTRIDNREHVEPKVGAIAKLISSVMYPSYVRGRSTKKFWVDDQCVGCGICASRCPVGAIEMVDGHPTWVKDKCVQCMACARCGAIQYGKKTVGRKRYTNPVLKKGKASEHDHSQHENA